MKTFPFLLFFIFNISMLRAQDIDSDLVMKIDFSNAVQDLTGNTVPQLSGMETFAEDRDGSAHCAAKFTGQDNEYVILPVNTTNQLVQGDIFTLSVWFKMDNVIMGNYEVLFQKGSTPTSGFEMALYDLNTPLVGDNTDDMGIWDNDWNQDENLPNDTENWHHLVMVLDGSSVKLYRDNVLRNTFDYTGDEFNIGTDVLNYEMGRGFIGYLDDVRLYKRALTAQEIDLLYNLPGSCESLGSVNFNKKNIQLVQPTNKTIQLLNLPVGEIDIAIYDLTGKMVFQTKKISLENNLLSLDFLGSSVYFMKIKNTQGLVSNHKFILK